MNVLRILHSRIISYQLMFFILITIIGGGIVLVHFKNDLHKLVLLLSPTQLVLGLCLIITTMLLLTSAIASLIFYVEISTRNKDISEAKVLEKIKRDFIANASHELRTPLTSIKGYIEILEQEPQKQQQYIDIIARNTDRIINIVNDLLKLSKLEQYNSVLNYEDINLNTLIEDIMQIFENKIVKKQISLHTLMPSPELLFTGDKLKIEALLINLIDNSIKYTDEHGSIDVNCSKTDNLIKIMISDTGIGIPQKYQSRVFERFFVVDKARSRKTGGTGLGLAIVKHIIQLHHGTLDLASQEGKGTTFTVTLPLEVSAR